MNIGVKYCGGCNNKYDRTAFLEKIKSEFSGNSFYYSNIDMEFDVVLVLCGCKSGCANYENIKSKNGYIIVTDENEYDLAKEEIMKLMNI